MTIVLMMVVGVRGLLYVAVVAEEWDEETHQSAQALNVRGALPSGSQIRASSDFPSRSSIDYLS